jgi:NCAIR mutase (PurE)-related protein
VYHQYLRVPQQEAQMAGQYTTVDGALVGVLMGSASDWPTMKSTSETLARLGIAHECNAISAHRAPERLSDYVDSAEKRGVKVFICAAGGAAHLGGVVAARTHLPVLGCPMEGWALEGLDALPGRAAVDGPDAEGGPGSDSGRGQGGRRQRRAFRRRDIGAVR